MNNIYIFLQNINMKTKYKLNNDELVVNFYFLYPFKDTQNKVKNIRKYINILILDENINFKGNKIVIYINGLLIGTFYLTNYYLKKLNYSLKNSFITEYNSYFYNNSIIEINNKNKIKFKKILTY